METLFVRFQPFIHRTLFVALSSPIVASLFHSNVKGDVPGTFISRYFYMLDVAQMDGVNISISLFFIRISAEVKVMFDSVFYCEVYHSFFFMLAPSIRFMDGVKILKCRRCSAINTYTRQNDRCPRSRCSLFYMCNVY